MRSTHLSLRSRGYGTPNPSETDHRTELTETWSWQLFSPACWQGSPFCPPRVGCEMQANILDKPLIKLLKVLFHVKWRKGSLLRGQFSDCNCSDLLTYLLSVIGIQGTTQDEHIWKLSGGVCRSLQNTLGACPKAMPWLATSTLGVSASWPWGRRGPESRDQSQFCDTMQLKGVLNNGWKCKEA